MMGFQDTACTGGCTGGFFQYQRLHCRHDGAAAATRPRWRWLRLLSRKAGSAAGLLRVKKPKWSRIASVLLPRSVAEFSSNKIHHAGEADADVCPTIIFSSQWGLPVLSHPSLTCKKVKYPYGRAIRD